MTKELYVIPSDSKTVKFKDSKMVPARSGDSIAGLYFELLDYNVYLTFDSEDEILDMQIYLEQVKESLEAMRKINDNEPFDIYTKQFAFGGSGKDFDE